MKARILLTVMCAMTAINVGILFLNMSTSSHARIAGKDYMDLKYDYDFKKAVEDIVEDCKVDGEDIRC